MLQWSCLGVRTGRLSSQSEQPPAGNMSNCMHVRVDIDKENTHAQQITAGPATTGEEGTVIGYLLLQWIAVCFELNVLWTVLGL